MNENLEERIKSDAELKYALNQDLSAAIGSVLESYGLTGMYTFNVCKGGDACETPVKCLKGQELVLPIYCLGSGYAKVEEPKKVGPI